MTCPKCNQPTIAVDAVDPMPYPVGVTPDGMVMHKLSPVITYWIHEGGRFCS